MSEYLFIKVAGRGFLQAPYHELGPDGSTPACGTRLQLSQWALWPVQAGTTYGRRRCQKCPMAAQAGRGRTEVRQGE
jgi:hypothetical protein